MHSSSTIFASYIFLAAPIITAQRLNARPTATISSGVLRGRATQIADSDVTVNQFLGVPFAQPPINDLRFAPPLEPSPWEEPYDASEQPNACIQFLGTPGPAKDINMDLFYNPPAPGESEDCLYLDVYAPEGGEADKAVLFWIYGGSGVAGAASQPLYDGTSLAANHDIIVVAANYRVNIFGTPSAPGLSLEDQNPGLLDQRLALNWTQQNIAAFGGDPGKVTIMGESNGAVSVGNLINTYPSNPPFRAGVELSGSAVYTPPNLAAGDLEDEWSQLITLSNCTDTSDAGQLECVRAIDAETLIEILESNNLKFATPVKNNITVLEHADVEWANRNVARVPTLIGSTADDASAFFISTPPSDLSIATLLETGLNFDASTAAAIADLYSPSSGSANSTTQILSQIATDFIFRCSSGFVANLTSTLLDVPVWQYVFDAQVPSNTWSGYPDLGVYHASEIALIFGTYPIEGSDEVEKELSRRMQKAFADFVRNPTGGPGWGVWPQLGIFERDGVRVGDVRVLDEVCGFYNPFYLSTLPGLLGVGDAGVESGHDTSSSDSGDSEAEQESAGSQIRVTAFSVGVGLLGLAVLVL